MGGLPESADTLYAGELEIRLGDGLVLASGRTRWLAHATREVQTAISVPSSSNTGLASVTSGAWLPPRNGSLKMISSPGTSSSTPNSSRFSRNPKWVTTDRIDPSGK